MNRDPFPTAAREVLGQELACYSKAIAKLLIVNDGGGVLEVSERVFGRFGRCRRGSWGIPDASSEGLRRSRGGWGVREAWRNGA